MKTSSIHLQTTNNLHSSEQFVLYSSSHLQQGQEGKVLNPIILRVRDQRKAEIRQFPYRRSSRTQFWHISTISKRLQSSEKRCESCRLGCKVQDVVSQERLGAKWWGKVSEEEETPFSGQALDFTWIIWVGLIYAGCAQLHPFGGFILHLFLAFWACV